MLIILYIFFSKNLDVQREYIIRSNASISCNQFQPTGTLLLKYFHLINRKFEVQVRHEETCFTLQISLTGCGRGHYSRPLAGVLFLKKGGFRKKYTQKLDFLYVMQISMFIYQKKG